MPLNPSAVKKWVTGLMSIRTTTTTTILVMIIVIIPVTVVVAVVVIIIMLYFVLQPYGLQSTKRTKIYKTLLKVIL